MVEVGIEQGAERAALISLRGIRKRYGGIAVASRNATPGDAPPEIEVLRGIDLDIHAGEFVAIVGASGSGKSTLMHILGCLDRPTSGSYRFEGRDVAGFDSDTLAWLRREAFGFVFQGYHLIATDSASENVQVPAIYAGIPDSERVTRADALLTRLGLADKLHHRPRQLSGGQQQRVSIARALMNGGRIILADEPTGALDTRSGAEVMALLRELAAAGHTIILITHDRDVAAQARRVIEIRDGHIVSDSGHDPALVKPLPSAAHYPGIAGTAGIAGNAGASDTLLADLREAARTAWRGMRLNRIRTALTLLGIIIGVASVVVMLAVGEGARQRVLDQMGTMGTTIMYMGSRPPPTGGPAGQITPEDLDAIAALPDIRRVMPVIGDPVTVRRGNADRQLYVFAASRDMPAVHHWNVERGRYYSDAEDRALAPVVVLGSKSREHFFGTTDPLGKQLLIGNSPFEVIGVMSERGAESGAQDYDNMVFIPYHAGRARVYQAQTQPDYVVVEAMSSARVYEAEAAIRKLLTARHNGREDFGVSNAAARLQAEVATRRSMSMMLGLIAAVSLVVGGIGVMNVMLMTVRERTREIGIRMATGARQRDILRQFLTEAAMVTILGGAVGLVAGVLLGAILLAVGVALVFSISAMILAFSCAVATGLIFGYMPARTAARLDPVIALAGE